MVPEIREERGKIYWNNKYFTCISEVVKAVKVYFEVFLTLKGVKFMVVWVNTGHIVLLKLRTLYLLGFLILFPLN